jgi:hypothetical protein
MVWRNKYLGPASDPELYDSWIRIQLGFENFDSDSNQF